jgi:wobble nucleotide-excising tRNase
MLEKLISVKNVGKFTNYNCQGDVTFRKLTLIYAGNGHGKTTLCDILRSLHTGDGRYISGRETLGSTGQPTVKLLLNNQPRTFANGKWDQDAREFLIFDASFVHENVHAGEQVTHAHKKNLYRIIIGDSGVSLARAVSELDTQLREATRDVGAKTTAVLAFAPTGMSARDFMALRPVEDIDTLIPQKTTELQALESAAAIQAKPSLRELSTLPQFPADYTSLLATTLEGISADVAATVVAHMSTHTAGVTEAWLSEGLRFVKANSCPFCGQSLAGIPLLVAFSAYFGGAYKAHMQRISGMITAIAERFGAQSQVLAIQHTVLHNANTCQGWQPLLTLKAPAFDFDAVSAAIDGIRAAALDLLTAKKQAPFDALSLSDDVRTAQARYAEAQAAVAAYNAAISQLNKAIELTKTATQAGNLLAVQRELARLHATRRRYDTDAVAACEALLNAEAHKKSVEKQKEEAKISLETFTTSVFDKYQDRMNRLLENFGAGFQIGDTKGRFVGGSPSSQYCVVINNKLIDIGESENPPQEQCFRNTLSAGDKSTLAFSFFIATVEKDSALADKILVFDDPFTSQDHSRRTWTQQLITTLSNAAKQVIVLSHDPSFLKLLYDGASGNPVKTLQLGGWGPHGSKVTEWDVAAATQASYIEFFRILAAYIHQGTGDKRQVAQTIRLLLEYYLRLKLPASFAENEWLGDMIQKIRECTDPTNPLHYAQPILGELTHINDYAKKYHHSVPGSATAHVDDAEVRTYAARAITLVQRF